MPRLFQDNVPPELVEVLQNSHNSFVVSLLTDVTPEQPGKKKKTVLSKFKVSTTVSGGTRI